jgi:hypothetical protein
VEEHLKKGSKAIDMLSSYLSERAKVEEEYAKSLQKLLKKTEAIADIGSLDKIWHKARTEMENECNLRTAFAQELKTAGKSVTDVASELKKTRKKHLSDAQSQKKEYDSLNSNIGKAQTKYNKACTEADKADQEVKTSEGKNLPKAQQKQQKAQQEKSKSEQEYSGAVQKLTQFQPTWEDKMTVAYDALQDVEVRRMDTVKSGWEQFEKAMRPLNNYVESFTKSINTLISGANPRQDLNDWIASSKSGTAPPALPVFQPYGAATVRAEPRKETGGGSSTPSTPTAGSGTKSMAPITRTPDPPKTTIPAAPIPPAPSLPRGPPPSSPPVAPPAAQEEEYAEEEYAEEEYAEEEYAEEEYAEEEYGEVVTAQWDYEKLEDNEISFKAGEQITIVSKDDEGWWTGTNAAGETGHVIRYLYLLHSSFFSSSLLYLCV